MEPPHINSRRTIHACLLAFVATATMLYAQVPATFEKPGYYPAQFLAPGVPLRGDQYAVRDKAYDDGLVATFWIDSNTGEMYTAVGKQQLYQRIAEIYAIAQLRQMDSGKEFGDSVGNGAKNTVTAVGKTLSDPGAAIASVPQGVSKFFGSLGEKLKGGKSDYEDKAYSNVLGASKAKRSLAIQLGVNPYSTNKTLIDELNRVGWSEAGGTVLIHLATAAIPAGAGMALNMNRTAQAEIVENDPSQLNIINRKKLEEVGVSDDTANLLLKHKWYSPVHRTVITEALVSLGPDCGQDVFLKVAQRASSEVDADYFQQAAQLIELYNQSRARVRHIIHSGNTVSFLDANGNWVFPVPFDYALWTENVHQRSQHAFAARASGQPILLYTTGQLSPATQAACDRDQVAVIQTSLDSN